MGNNMNILNFRKRESVDVHQELINEFISVRTKLKQLKLQKDKLIEKMNEAEKEKFIYNNDNLPIAKLTVSDCPEHTVKASQRRTWRPL
jgi:hypothetical protein